MTATKDSFYLEEAGYKILGNIGTYTPIYIASYCRRVECFLCAKLRLATIHLVMSVSLFVCPHGITRLPQDPFSRNLIFLENLSRKIKLFENLTRITGTLHEDWYTFIFTSHSVLLRMKNFSEKDYRENQTRSLCSITFFKKFMSFMR